MHAGLLASSGDVRAACRLGVTGTDVEALLAELSVAHSRNSLLKVGEFLLGVRRSHDGRVVLLLELADKRMRAVPEE